jgi:ankyrin repeat protein
VRLLISAGADVNSRNDDNITPLHYQRDEGVVRLLISAGADVNSRSNSDNTPLHYKKMTERCEY